MTAHTAPTLADFEDWLNAEQQRALDGMDNSTGTVYHAHLDDFMRMNAPITAVWQFQNARRSVQSATGGEG